MASPIRSKLTTLGMASVIAALFVALLAPVHAQDSTPQAPSADVKPLIETLLDLTTDALPTGHAVVAVDRWTLKPSETALTLPPRGEVVMIAVDSGVITVTTAGSEQQLASGDMAILGNQEVALHTSDPEGAIVFLVYVISGFMDTTDTYVLTSDATAHAVDFVISTSADALPGGSARLILERLTLPPGSALPPQEANPFV